MDNTEQAITTEILTRRITDLEAQLAASQAEVKHYQESEDKIGEILTRLGTMVGLLDENGNSKKKKSGEDGEDDEDEETSTGSLIFNFIRENISFTGFVANRKREIRRLKEKFAFLGEISPIIDHYVARKNAGNGTPAANGN